MLMVLCQSTRTNHITPVSGLALVDIDYGHDAGSSSFDHNAARLIELKGKDVLVVGKGDDELNDKFAATCQNCSARAPIGMLPVDAVVLFVNADDVGSYLSVTVSPYDHAVKILDDTETITPELQIVSTMTKTTITEVEGLFTVEGWSWVGIGNGLRTRLAEAKYTGRRR